MARKPKAEAGVGGTCANCGSGDASCSAGARAFRKGADRPEGATWAVCRRCRSLASHMAREYKAAGRSWVGVCGLPK